MIQIDFSSCNEEELWHYVAVHLKKHGIDTVLVGGSVVSIYSRGAYRSGDLDFILTNMFVDNLAKIMSQIGFVRNGRHFIHPECNHLFVEFPSGPLGIGDDYRIKPAKVDVQGTIVKILSPTDCVKDRLASYIYFKDRECFDQAILVASIHPVNLGKIKRWCVEENALWAFEEFLLELG